MVCGKIFTWYYCVLLARKKHKKREYLDCKMLHLWCHLTCFTLPAQHVKSLSVLSQKDTKTSYM